ncbi:hypothetical protein HMPREF1608_00952 [Escherichia coli 908525]|uniref:Uncharacterized protein n=1 Tax=Escherichia coli (strain SMS-3-5 / SECEC) TaxID=439855 RepID=B1LCZ1_ECOSM|nr:hypothetical protein EcSMS35_1306 [Escherichia coli SMS-3-5]ESD03820.1 hypothetical protein HMPREF1595_04662 [Escherichia coli 907672]ESD77245.1 hypothetical protein HMPREF1608_00952 [Escherichia coli 908525]
MMPDRKAFNGLSKGQNRRDLGRLCKKQVQLQNVLRTIFQF